MWHFSDSCVKYYIAKSVATDKQETVKETQVCNESMKTQHTSEYIRFLVLNLTRNAVTLRGGREVKININVIVTLIFP